MGFLSSSYEGATAPISKKTGVGMGKGEIGARSPSSEAPGTKKGHSTEDVEDLIARLNPCRRGCD